MIGSVLYPWVNGDPLNPGFRARIPVQSTQGYKTDPIMICKNSTWYLSRQAGATGLTRGFGGYGLGQGNLDP